MTSMIAEPQLMETAAADAAGIGSALNQAKAAAAFPTTGVVAAAGDEVSAMTASLFSTYGHEYQALLQRAGAFHDQFVATLTAASNTYTQAEAQIASSLGLGGGGASTTSTVGATMKAAADPAVNQILIMGGSGHPNPPQSYMDSVYNLFMNNPNNTYTQLGSFNPFLRAVATAEGLYPFTGTKDLTLDISLARGVTSLDNAIKYAFDQNGFTSLGVLGYSQSAIVASMEMPNLVAEGYTPSQISFTLIGDPSAPNGGLFARFPGLTLPSLGATFGTATPSNDFPTTIYTLEYDGFADFPQYPIDVFSDLNALAGILFVHGTYPDLTSTDVATGFLLPGSEALGTPDSMTNYYMIPTTNLPLLDPVRAIPVIGNPIADLLQPDLTYLVNWGYGDPNYGYSTGPANVPTPFGFLPPLSATMALGPDLASGTQAGMAAFANDVSAMVPTSLPAISLPSLAGVLGGASTGSTALALPSMTSIPSTLTNIIAGIETANTTFVGTLTNNIATAYSTLLPTADIATAVVVSLPSYDLNLFLNGITQAINGQPLQGLINAFGDPIAADVGLVTLAGGFEFISIANSLDTIITGTPNPGP